jgi:DNA modification methylase
MITKQKELKNIGQVKLNNLIQGDCLEVMKFIADKSIDMVLCDLHYG